MYASIRVQNPGCEMKVKGAYAPEVGTLAPGRRRTIDRSGSSLIDLSESVSVGTRKIANYACIG